jgi:hypothetical protein
VLCERRWNYKNHDEPQQDTKIRTISTELFPGGNQEDRKSAVLKRIKMFALGGYLGGE